ncbi:branched-chain amino acid transport system II carrier protein, partial [Escherichia coli]|nr:branched-chain amino acid transport system II carrier protein [Escherichia coli]
FSVLFFVVVLFFSLKPSRILDWVGKILNPLFLVVLSVLVITALIHPMGNIGAVAAHEDYAHQAFFTGFLEGYNTMDALAS